MRGTQSVALCAEDAQGLAELRVERVRGTHVLLPRNGAHLDASELGLQLGDRAAVGVARELSRRSCDRWRQLGYRLATRAGSLASWPRRCAWRMPGRGCSVRGGRSGRLAVSGCSEADNREEAIKERCSCAITSETSSHSSQQRRQWWRRSHHVHGAAGAPKEAQQECNTLTTTA